jgi:antitoxin MazE
MRTSLRKIGNSRGIIIPAALLASAEIGEEVELRQEAGRLVIEAVRAPRAGWFDGYNAEEDEDFWADLPFDEGIDEWVW